MSHCKKSYRHILPLVNTSHVSAKRLHPFKGLPTVITHKMFPLSVNRLVSVQSARCDKGLSAYFTSVRPFSCVCPDMSSEVGTVAETLFTDRAAVGFLFSLLAVIVVVEVKG